MHKNPLQNTGKGIKEILFFKIFRGGGSRTPLEVSAPSACLPPPQKFLGPYACGILPLTIQAQTRYGDSADVQQQAHDLYDKL